MGEMATFGLKYRYARLAGDIEKVKAANAKIAKELGRLNLLYANNLERISKLTVELDAVGTASSLAFQVDLAGTESRMTVPKAHHCAWGSITRILLTQLRCSEGIPLNSKELAQGLAFELGQTGDEEFASLKKATKYCLKRLANQGVVARVGKADQTQRYMSWVIADSVG